MWLSGDQRKEAALQSLRKAAWEVLAERGIQRFSAEAVAERAGCSRATLYRMVGGKAALLESLLGEASALVVAKIRRETEGLTGPERVVRVMTTALAQVRAVPEIEQWARSAAAQDYGLGRSDQFAALGGELVGAGTSPDAGQWIHRVFMMFLMWPAPSPEVEEQLMRDYLAPAFR